MEALGRASAEEPVPLGRYDVVGRLGRGGMSTIYDAVDRERGVKVALKTLRALDAAGAVHLKREFRTAADLSHPNLVPVFELDHDREIWFFTMERVEGASLMEWMRGVSDPSSGERSGRGLPLSRTLDSDESAAQRGGFDGSLGAYGERLDEDTVVESKAAYQSEIERRGKPAVPLCDMSTLRDVFEQLTKAIGALHKAGLRHGDVKPANILVRPNGQVVVVDFGLARPIDELREGRRIGTPAYMAPEQLTDAHVGPAADWYALGATLYGMLTGWKPFIAATTLELYLKKMHHAPPPPRALLSSIPRDLSDLCLALLRPDPRERPDQATVLSVFSGSGAELSSADGPRRPRLFVGRGRQLEILEQAFGSANSGRLTVAHVHGPSGIGKSALLESFLEAARGVGASLILRGRCYERERVPYKGFDRAIDALVVQLRKLQSSEVDALLPLHTGALVRTFPAFEAVESMAQRARRDALPQSPIEIRQRAWGALLELLQALGERQPVILTIDDLQWSDEESARLLERLLETTKPTRLLVVVVFRPEETNESALLRDYLALSQKLASERRLVDVVVGPLEPAEAGELALQALGERATSEHRDFVVREARGIPIFIEQLSLYLARTSKGELPSALTLEGAIMALARGLAPAQRDLLQVIAVANSPLPQSVVFEAAGLSAGALADLLALRSVSFVDWRGSGAQDVVWVYHDRIRESVVGHLTDERKREIHLALGRALRDIPGQDWLFDAARHLSAAADLIRDDEEKRSSAELLSRAGEAARKAAAYALGFECFDAGIALLGERGWEGSYDLALRLHAGAVETAYLSGRVEVLAQRTADLKVHARSPLDELVAWETEIDSLAGSQQYATALEAGCAILKKLGVELALEPGVEDVQNAVGPTLARLEEIGLDGMRALPELADSQDAAVTRILVRLSPVAYFGRPLLLPIIACNLVTRSIQGGVSTATPYGLSLFGIVLNTMEMFEVSHAWGQLSLELLERWPEDRRLETATRHILFNLVCNWTVPLESTLDSLRAVVDLGQKTGDYEYAGFAAHGYTHNSIYAGRPLGPLKKEAFELGELLETFGVNALHVHRPFEQLLKALTGDLTSPARLDDDGFDEDEALEKSYTDDARSSICVMNLTTGMARYFFGVSAEASERMEEARAHLDGAPSVWHPPIVHQYAALAAAAAFQETTDDSKKEAFRDRVQASLAPLQRLVFLNDVNFAHRLSLIEGLLAQMDGQREQALAHFEHAASQASRGRWSNDVAIAHQLAASCRADASERRASLQKAWDAYEAWGARAVSAIIAAQLAEL